jgi:hypothetical protein
MGADTPRATRAKTAAAQRVERIAFHFPEFAVFNIGDGAAFPETNIAEGGDLLDSTDRGLAVRARGVAAAATPTAVPEIFKNLRRERSFMSVA